jgi:glycosyltransferase involved in cell wall biosynthesis
MPNKNSVPDTAEIIPGHGLVSVIIPTFNRGRTLRRAIMSVLQQSYTHLEVLVVDDGSTDNTAGVMAAISDPRVRYIPLEQNRGASRARNAGLREARGRVIAFQDSDDEWLADKLQRQVEAAVAAGGGAVTVFHTKVLYGRDAWGTYGHNRVCILPEIPPAEVYDFHRLIQEINIISPQALLITREALEAVGLFDEDLVNNNDWAFAIELVYNTHVVFIDEPLVMTYLQPDSIMRLKRTGVRSQIRILQKLNRFPDAHQPTIAGHLGRLGWGMAKLGNPRRGRRLLMRALRLAPSNWKNWARLGATQGRIVLGMTERKAAVPVR